MYPQKKTAAGVPWRPLTETFVAKQGLRVGYVLTPSQAVIVQDKREAFTPGKEYAFLRYSTTIPNGVILESNLGPWMITFQPQQGGIASAFSWRAKTSQENAYELVDGAPPCFSLILQALKNSPNPPEIINAQVAEALTEKYTILPQDFKAQLQQAWQLAVQLNLIAVMDAKTGKVSLTQYGRQFLEEPRWTK